MKPARKKSGVAGSEKVVVIEEAAVAIETAGTAAADRS
jgi:hypothetical protein